MRHVLVLLTIFLFCSCKPSKDLIFQDLQGFSIKQTTPPSATVSVRMYNPNKYKLKLKKADVSVFINGNELGKMQVAGTPIAPAQDTFLLPVTISIDPKYSLLNVMQWVMAGDINIKVTGTMKGGRSGIYKTVPVLYEGRQNLRAQMGF